MYEIIFRVRFEKEFKKLDKKIQRQILTNLEELTENPFKHPQIRKIVGVKPLAFRMRIGRWRVLYFVISKDKIIEVLEVFLRKRKDDYRKRI